MKIKIIIFIIVIIINRRGKRIKIIIIYSGNVRGSRLKTTGKREVRKNRRNY